MGMPPYLKDVRFRHPVLYQYGHICNVRRRRPKGEAESRRRQVAAGGGRRQQQAGRHGRGRLRASLYIAQKGGGRPARSIGSTAGGAERQRGGANRPSIILLFIIIIYIIH